MSGGKIEEVMWKVDNSDIVRGELGILKKKHMVVHKDLEDQKSGIHSMQVGFEIFNIQIFNAGGFECCQNIADHLKAHSAYN